MISVLCEGKESLNNELAVYDGQRHELVLNIFVVLLQVLDRNLFHCVLNTSLLLLYKENFPVLPFAKIPKDQKILKTHMVVLRLI